MGDRALIITDNVRGRWVNRFSRHINKRPYEASILTLGITPEYFIKSTPHRSEVLNNYKFTDVDDVFEETQERIRDFYINFIFELPKKIPPELLFCKGKNLWWALDITEKCPVRSKIVYRLFYLELIRSVIARDIFNKIYIDLDDRLLAQIILKWKPDEIEDISCDFFTRYKTVLSGSLIYFISRYIKNCFGVALLFTARSLALKVNRINGVEAKGKDRLFFYTNYPSWWHDPNSDKTSEKFFDSLPESLAQKYPVFYATWLFSLSPLKIFFKREYLKYFFNRKKMVILECLLKAGEKLSILSFEYLFWALSVRDYFKRTFDFTYNNFNISRLLYYEICNSLSHSELFNDILIENAFRRLVEVYSPKALVYRLEFSPFEKSMLLGMDGKCKTISLQHSTLSRNVMSHSFAPGEIPFYLEKKNFMMAMPLPDLIFTAGAYFRDIMIKAGFPQERIYICGPIRYAKLVSCLKRDIDKVNIKKKMGFSDTEKIFLVAMNWIEKEGMALIPALVEAGKDMNKKFNFVLRNHPHMRYDNSILTFLKKSGSNFKCSFLSNEFSLYDVMLVSDGVIQVPTTLGYEAIAIGRMPIIYENRHVYNAQSLEELRECVFIAHSQSELRDAIYSVADDDERVKRLKQKWAGVLENFFYDINSDPQEKFVELLRKERIFG